MHILLKPFMIAQKLLEGQTYVTISLVPYIIYKIRKGLQEAIDSPNATDYIRSIAAEMIQVLNTHFGQGGSGTVATEYLKMIKRKRPKRINILALMASFLDPSMKWELGCRTKTKTIYEKIIEAIIGIATM